MKTQFNLFTAFALIGLMISSPLYAQQGQRRMSMQKHMMKYDTNTVETFSGEISEIVYEQAKRGQSNMVGVHLIVKTETESIPVHLGPVWYIKNQDSFQNGDHVTVTGSRITIDNAPAVVASKVVRGEMTLRLRDQKGFPAWRGWRRSQMMNR